MHAHIVRRWQQQQLMHLRLLQVVLQFASAPVPWQGLEQYAVQRWTPPLAWECYAGLALQQATTAGSSHVSL